MFISIMIKTRSMVEHQSDTQSEEDEKNNESVTVFDEQDSSINSSKNHSVQYPNDICKIVNELISLISIPKITKEYIDKMKGIVHTSEKKSEVHKYTKWILCMTYLIPVINMYMMNDNRVKLFIERHKNIANNGVVAVQNGSITYYDICVPIDPVDLKGVEEYVDSHVLNFITNLIENKNSKEHRILTKMTEHIFLVVCRSDYSFGMNNDSTITDLDSLENRKISFCWQFKDMNEKRKIDKMISKNKNQLISQIDKTNLYIRYDPKEIVKQIMNVKQILDTETCDVSSIESDDENNCKHQDHKLSPKIHQMPLRKCAEYYQDELRSSDIDNNSDDYEHTELNKNITVSQNTSETQILHKSSSIESSCDRSDNNTEDDRIKSEYCESLDKQINRFKKDTGNTKK